MHKTNLPLLIKRLKKHKSASIQKACGVKRQTIEGLIKGRQKSVQTDTYNKLVDGLNSMEGVEND